MKRLFLAAGLAFATAAYADPCERTIFADGSFTIACKAAPATAPPVDPTGPTKPTTPVDPPPPPPPPPAADPGVSAQFAALVAQRPALDLGSIFFHIGRAFTPAELAYARSHNVPGASPATPTSGDAPPSGQPGGEETFTTPFFQFRCGDQRKLYGPSGSYSVVATRDATVNFTVGESSFNETPSWHITATVNGRSVWDAHLIGVFQKAPDFGMRAGETLTITVSSDEPGKQVSAWIRLSVDGC